MQFIPATNYTPVAGRSIDLLVIHDGEVPEKPTSAEGMANFFHGQPRGPGGSSTHFSSDNNSTVQSVKDHDVAWAAPGANHDGLHFEHAGVARQTEAEWLDAYSSQMLFKISAPLFAEKADKYDIPPVFLRAPALAAQKRGITTHWEITKAFSHGQGHTDPGSNFPIERFMHAIQTAMGVHPENAHAAGIPVKRPNPTIKQGAHGYLVKQLQRLLNFEEKRAWDDIKVDGSFGARTKSEVQEFQQRAGLRSDGIVGPSTWAALWEARFAG